ncbi:MAG TPA: PDZ domain-containing protein, partial [Acidobacteria bacterium]|nr:PDZ domain-containing protein [Acidobacteriota bacterium]
MRNQANRIVLVALTATVLAFLSFQMWDEAYAASRRIGITVALQGHRLKVDEVSKGMPADRAGLQPGDIIVAVDGIPIRSGSDYDEVAATFRRGRPVPFTIERNGKRLILPVAPGTPFPWLQALMSIVATLSYLAIALLAFPGAPRDVRHLLLAAFSGAVALELATPNGALMPYVLSLGGTLLFYLLTGIQMGLLLHLASVIPSSPPWMKKRRWIPYLYYGIGLSASTLISISIVTDAMGHRILPWPSEVLDGPVFDVLMSLWAVAVILILTYQVARSTGRTERAQALLVLIGLLPWAIFTLTTEIVPQLGYSLPDWLTIAQLLVLLPYPVTVFLAIQRHRLFDIELVVRRSILYSGITIVLVALFYGAMGLGGMVLADYLGKRSTSIWLISGATLLVGLLFWPLRQAIQDVIDRKIFPERHALRTSLASLAANLPAKGSLDAMGRHLVNELTRTFTLSSATLLVADPGSGILVAQASNVKPEGLPPEHSLIMGPDDPAMVYLAEAGRPLPAAQVAAVSSSMALRLRTFEASLAVPLLSGNRVAGVLLLGAKQGGEPWRREELELLRLFALNVAAVLENVRLFQSATYEGLTGLYRREAILEILEKEMHRSLRYGRPLTVVMADIDFFKR